MDLYDQITQTPLHVSVSGKSRNMNACPIGLKHDKNVIYWNTCLTYMQDGASVADMKSSISGETSITPHKTLVVCKSTVDRAST